MAKRATTVAKMKMTPALAHAAGWDAGNRSMRAAGRTKWSRKDWNEAARVTNEMMALVDWSAA